MGSNPTASTIWGCTKRWLWVRLLSGLHAGSIPVTPTDDSVYPDILRVMEKLCPACSIVKTSDQFGLNRAKPDGKQTQCRQCRKATNRKYYERTKEVHNPSRHARREREKARVRDYVLSVLLREFCVDCGTSDVRVLEFDHVTDGKLFNISEAAAKGYSNQAIAEEIKKCEVVCANCHRIRTGERAQTARHQAHVAQMVEQRTLRSRLPPDGGSGQFESDRLA